MYALFQWFPTRGQFHQFSTSSFYACRSWKCKIDWQLDYLFALSGFAWVKAACKMLMKLTPGSRNTHEALENALRVQPMIKNNYLYFSKTLLRLLLKYHLTKNGCQKPKQVRKHCSTLQLWWMISKRQEKFAPGFGIKIKFVEYLECISLSTGKLSEVLTAPSQSKRLN